MTLGLTSCASVDDSGTDIAADCSAQVRLDGTTYTSYGFTSRDAGRYAAADQSECHDIGEDPAGSVFPEHPHQVTAWRFSGYSPGRVVGVRVGARSFAVYVADSTSPQGRDHITRDLRRPMRR